MRVLQNNTSFSEKSESIKSQKERAEQQVFVKVASRKEEAQACGWPVAKNDKRKEFSEFAKVGKGN